MKTNASKRIACAAVGSIGLLLCAAAQAQPVRKCQVDGRLVYQSSPCAVEARAASTVPQAPASNPPGSQKKKVLADLLRERDSAYRDRSPMGEAERDGADVLRARMGAV